MIRRGRSLVLSRWGRLALLVVLCAVPAGVEAWLVQYGLGLSASTYVSVQASALWPYDTFHDVRWVLVYHRSWAGFVGESVAAIVVRGLFCTVLTALAWPALTARPSLRRLAARNVMFAAVLGGLLSPWAAMSVVVSDVSQAWYLFGAILPVLIMAPFLQRGAIVPNWWRGLPPVGTVVLSVLNFVSLSAGSALVASVPPSWWTAAAALAGGVSGLLWYWAVRVAVLHQSVRWRRVPATPIVVAVVVSLMFAIGNVSQKAASGGQRSVLPALAALEARGIRQPVIFLAGYNSRYDGHPDGSTLPVVQYSYRGLYPDGRPRPYSAVDTHQSMVTSAQRLAEQVDRVHRATGQKVALVGESEGAVITSYYLKVTPHQAVDTAVMLSPVIRAGRDYYPPRNRSTGWGVATGWELRAIFAVLGAGTGLPNSADQPFVRSLLENGPLFRGKQVLCPASGIRMLAFVPTFDGLTTLPGLEPEIPVVHVVGLHGRLIDDPGIRRQLVEFLNEGQYQPHRSWDYIFLQKAGAAWIAPALKTQLNPVWSNIAGYSTRNYRASMCLRR